MDDLMQAFLTALDNALDDGIPAEELQHEFDLAVASHEREKSRPAEPRALKKKPKMKA